MLSEKPRSPVSEHRKVTKSAMEKKRRARINSSLTELKTILAGIMAYKDERFEKMEKADILEMTVNYVRQLQNKSMEKDKQVHCDADDYRSGVNSCIGEIIRLVTSSDVCDTDTKTKLLDHLANKVNILPTATKVTNLPSPVNTNSFSINVPDSGVVMPADANNNSVKDANFSTQTTPVSIFTTQIPMNSVNNTSAYSPQMVSPVSSMQTAITVPNVQNMGPINQTSPQVMSNVPLTILVPANFCTTAAGTTCVIPLTLSNNGSETNILFNPNGVVGDAASGVLGNSNSSVDVQGNVQEQNVSVSKTGKLDSNINQSHAIRNDNEIRTLPKKSAHYREIYDMTDRNESVIVKKASENIPLRSPDLTHSESNRFQQFPSRKSPSPYNRPWRPW